ncbi:hypothetical protein EVAR_37679_1 [Eumeta japonica]|uniref:Uncharacterized protein n=1 Tax=Eumeta variegata TaxID=151549 RepID=A0A4C1Z1V5_EUMVA|nr:hypothetical protein EVAR_37679_1 [Eumeta japonica]
MVPRRRKTKSGIGRLVTSPESVGRVEDNTIRRRVYDSINVYAPINDLLGFGDVSICDVISRPTGFIVKLIPRTTNNESTLSRLPRRRLPCACADTKLRGLQLLPAGGVARSLSALRYWSKKHASTN